MTDNTLWNSIARSEQKLLADNVAHLPAVVAAINAKLDGARAVFDLIFPELPAEIQALGKAKAQHIFKVGSETGVIRNLNAARRFGYTRANNEPVTLHIDIIQAIKPSLPRGRRAPAQVETAATAE